MKKKVLSAMLVSAMVASLFAGCGSDKGGDVATGGSTNGTEAGG